MILVDSSVWIAYFKGLEEVRDLNNLIDQNKICINDLILAELIPSIIHKKEDELRELLYQIERVPLNINWKQLVYMQSMNLKNGINRVGIADIIIAQNVIDNGLKLYSIDKHFELMSELHGIQLYKE